MKLKLDQNLPYDLATELAAQGHDVRMVVEEQLTGRSDPVVVAKATDEGRMVLTLDRGGASATCGTTRLAATRASSCCVPSARTRRASWG